MTVGHRPRVGRAFRRIALLGATALLFALLPGGVAFAEHFENTEVLDADSATEASVNWSQFTFDEATDAALGRNDKFPDNLASSVIQGTLDAPLLLTDSDTLSEEVAEELERLGVTDVHVLGGDTAISEDVVDELEDLGYDVHRESGPTRIETAIDIAAAHAPDATEGLLVRAFGDANGDETRAWADALAAGGWAAEEGMPVFLTQTEELNDNLRAYLEGSDIESITIVGGTSAISAAVVSELESMGIAVDRVSGSNRFATAVAVAAARGFDSAADATEVILSEGQQSDAWAGGFTAAAYSARSGAPIVLSNGPGLPPETVEFLEGAEGTGDVRLICGPFVEPEACAEAAAILGHEPAAHTNQDFTATPADTATNTVSTATGDNVNRGSRTYTVTGLDDAQTYNIALLPSDEVSSDADDNFSFGDNEGAGNQADNIGTTDSGNAAIESINGAAVAASQEHVGDDETAVSPVNGQITFTLDSLVADSTIPVVFRDADNDSQLDLDATDMPAEEFAVGGRKNWVPEEAASGDPTADEAITAVHKDDNVFVANGKSYFYDSNDTFQRATAATAGTDEPSTCVQVTQETFEAGLSAGDELDQGSVYNRDEAFASVFCLEDAEPAGPTAVAANVDGSNSDTVVDVAWTPEAGIDSQRLYRRQVATGTTDAQCAALALTDYTLVSELSATASTFEVTGLTPETTYCFLVTSVDDGDESDPDLDSVDPEATAATAAAQTPTSTGVTFSTNETTTDNRLDADDTVIVQFDRAVTAAAGDTIDLIDNEGDVNRITCGTNANCVVGGTDNRVLTVDLTGDPTVQTLRVDGQIDTDVDVEVLTSTIGNTTGDWNTAESGLTANERVFNQGNTATNELNLVENLDPATDISSSAATNQVTIAANLLVDAGETIRVYDFNGNVIGTGTAAAGGGATINTSGFDAGDMLRVLYVDSDAATGAGNSQESETAEEAAGA